MRTKHLISLALLVGLQLVPAGLARLAGGTPQTMLLFALLQMILTLLLVCTVPVSLLFSLFAARRKEWKYTLVYLCAGGMPFLAGWLGVLINEPGWQAVMSV